MERDPEEVAPLRVDDDCQLQARPAASSVGKRTSSAGARWARARVSGSADVSPKKDGGKAQAPPAPTTVLRPAVVTVGMMLGVVLGGVITHTHHAQTEQSLRDELAFMRDEVQGVEEQLRTAEEEQQALARLVLDPRTRGRVENLMERSRAFEAFVRENGFDSTPDSTVKVRECIGRIIRELKIDSILDIPCGDASWQHLIPGIDNVTYVGADMNVMALDRAKRLPAHRKKDMNFMLFDAVSFPLKRGFDLIIYRDVIEQQRLQDALSALLSFKSSGSEFVAMTYWPQSTEETNMAAYNLPHAGWYEPNLLRKPFNLPEPLLSCPDGHTQRSRESRLGVWPLDGLPVSALAVDQARPELHKVVTTRSPLPAAEVKPQVSNPGVHLPPKDSLWQAQGAAELARAIGGGEKYKSLFSDYLSTEGKVQHGLPNKKAVPPEYLMRMAKFDNMFLNNPHFWQMLGAHARNNPNSTLLRHILPFGQG